MKNTDVLVCVAGWEDRFVKGLKADIDGFKPGSIQMFVFGEFAASTERQRTDVLNHAWFSDIDCTIVTLRREPKEVWATLKSTFEDSRWLGRNVLVDITTMPREVIWWTLTGLVAAGCNISYVYHHPQRYSSTWLTRDTATPRLVYQYSGIAKLGKPTALLLLNGFDKERAAQMVQFFEPRLLLLGLQTGEQFDNISKNIEQSDALRQTMKNISVFEIDAFSPDFGYSILKSTVEQIADEYNIVAASLGPKTSAISLFLLTREFPEIALAYAPSRQFNMEYSSGIGTSLTGALTYQQWEGDE